MGAWASLRGFGVLIALANSGGCAAQMAGQNQLAYELAQARDDAAAQRTQVTALEARLAVLERDTMSKRARSAQDAPVLAKLDHLISVNEKLVERISASAHEAPANQSIEPAPPARSTPADGSDDNACADGLTPEEQLERLVRRMHGHAGAGFRGGLSLEQSQALRVLLRRERELDERSPWQAW
jgi:hypothetical protein